MTRRQAFDILRLAEGASADEIKRAYRKLAFDLHPDLHPDDPEAGRAFQRLNEAYVLLSSPPSASRGRAAPRPRKETPREATERARADAERAYSRAKKRFQEEMRSGSRAGEDGPPGTPEEKREKVLRDLLRDPFARRVFEDIYSQIRSEAEQRQRAEQKRPRKTAPARSQPGLVEKAGDRVSDWLRRQIDEELTVHMKGPLGPGKRVRLQIHQGLLGKARAIELTLPPEFEQGKPIRLKGLGKKVGKWQGDLYLRILEHETGGESK